MEKKFQLTFKLSIYSCKLKHLFIIIASNFTNLILYKYKKKKKNLHYYSIILHIIKKVRHNYTYI